MKGGIALENGEASKALIGGSESGVNKGLSILDFIMRLLAIVGTLASAISMGTTDETLPFFTQFIQFKAQYDDLPSFTYDSSVIPSHTFFLFLLFSFFLFNYQSFSNGIYVLMIFLSCMECRFFVIANAIVCGYIVLSLPVSIFHIVRSRARGSRLILIFFDTAMLALLTAGASAAAAIVYLAHNGNASANWFAICQQFNSFCERISGSLIGSFGAMIMFILIILFSAVALSRR
ncbi:casparian strip membrane protein 1-like isoform X1 [Magnolia sinica]|uniref:casparian strip membrane protein 1-like isoform X1 n=1 Tax=Magnolia sinica TaxID=86752 RepID=UPI00265B55A0|nr:casparian strip membrane protein 1-like isoform X1 [Magnolia sinica]